MTRLALLEATGRLFVAGFDWPLAMLGLAARVLAATLAARHGPAQDEFQRALRHALPAAACATAEARFCG